MLLDLSKQKITGHLRIFEEETGNVLLDRHNAIHPENFSIAIADALSNNNGFIKEMVFGNGGVRVNSSNSYLYSSPQTIGRTASLYNETYSKVVDQNSSDNVNKSRNNMTISHVTGNIFTDIMIQCSLEKNEPSKQDISEENNDIISDYTFNEVGLRTYKNDLITHICFSPILKTSNRTLVFNYLLRIMIV